MAGLVQGKREQIVGRLRAGTDALRRVEHDVPRAATRSEVVGRCLAHGAR